MAEEEKTEHNKHANPQVIFSWKAPLRAYVKRGKNVMRFYIALALLLSVLVVFLNDAIVLIPLWTLLFLFYVFTITPPPEVEHRITQFGIESAGVTYRWEDLSHFYFFKRFGYDILTLVSHPPYFHHIFLVVPHHEQRAKILKILSDHIIYQEEPRKGFTDRLVDWFSNLVPHEDDDKGPFDVSNIAEKLGLKEGKNHTPLDMKHET